MENTTPYAPSGGVFVKLEHNQHARTKSYDYEYTPPHNHSHTSAAV